MNNHAKLQCKKGVVKEWHCHRILNDVHVACGPYSRPDSTGLSLPRPVQNLLPCTAQSYHPVWCVDHDTSNIQSVIKVSKMGAFDADSHRSKSFWTTSVTQMKQNVRDKLYPLHEGLWECKLYYDHVIVYGWPIIQDPEIDQCIFFISFIYSIEATIWWKIKTPGFEVHVTHIMIMWWFSTSFACVALHTCP